MPLSGDAVAAIPKRHRSLQSNRSGSRRLERRHWWITRHDPILQEWVFEPLILMPDGEAFAGVLRLCKATNYALDIDGSKPAARMSSRCTSGVSSTKSSKDVCDARHFVRHRAGNRRKIRRLGENG
jgi:hypothetical protein